MRLSRFGALAALVFMSASARAGLIVNGSFELGDYSPVVADSYVNVPAGSTKITGWTIGGAGVDWHQNSFEMQSAHGGTKMVDLNLAGGGLSDTGTLSQSFTTIVGSEYTLTFYLAGPGLNLVSPREVQVDIAGVSQVFSQAPSNPLELDWGLKSLTFTAISTTTTLTFSSVNGLGYWGPMLDDVDVVSNSIATPEPSTFAAAGLGMIALVGLRRRSARR